jgi:hypothetical protein
VFRYGAQIGRSLTLPTTSRGLLVRPFARVRVLRGFGLAQLAHVPASHGGGGEEERDDGRPEEQAALPYQGDGQADEDVAERQAAGRSSLPSPRRSPRRQGRPGPRR